MVIRKYALPITTADRDAGYAKPPRADVRGI
jgi:hypothetical protein